MNRRTRGGAARTRWAAIGAAVAVTLGGGGVGLVSATVSTGVRPVFVAMTPCRILDVRADSQVGVSDAPLGAGDIVTVAAHGTNGDCTDIPADAIALSMNVTAITATLPTFLTIWSAGEERPETSNLNPAPGEPPTPNAVTTELSTNGEFNIYNLQGSVEVLVDVDGYYVDHDHDDRYDTSAEVDAKIAAIGPDTIRRGVLDFEPTSAGTSWTRTFIWDHTGATDECIFAPIDPVPGQTVATVTGTYQNAQATPQNMSIGLFGSRTTPGVFDNPGDVTYQVSETIANVAPSPADELEELSSALLGDPVIRDDYRYSVVICSSGDLSVLGANVALTGP